MVQPIDQMRAVLHFRNHRDTYNKIRGRLLSARRKYEADSEEGRRLRLVKAHSWSVISIQTPVEVHEQAFKDLWDGVDSVEDIDKNLPEALSSVNYKNNKESYIREFAADVEAQSEIDSRLMAGRLDDAQKYIIDNVKGVGTVKAPFMLGNNGFTEKMCVDANVISLTGVEKPETVVVEKYNNICHDICQMFPALNKVLDPYVLQWVIFCYKRNKDGRLDGVDTHDVWFENIGVA
jgi:thermostable 8-oxoguanine DNA glycosylase